MKAEIDSRDLDVSTTRAVRVTVPAKVAYDLEKIQGLERDLFERLGHAMCYSGFDIRWRIEDDFFVNPEMKLIAR